MNQARASLDIKSLVKRFSKKEYRPSVMYLPQIDEAILFLADDSYTLSRITPHFDIHRGNKKYTGKITGCSINAVRKLFREAGMSVPERTTLGRVGGLLLTSEAHLLGRKYCSWINRMLIRHGRLRVDLRLV